jgi:hypothetical protein
VSVTGRFLAEKCLPANVAIDLAALVNRDRAAAHLASIRHVRRTYAPSDETRFSLFEAASLETIQKANDRFQNWLPKSDYRRPGTRERGVWRSAPSGRTATHTVVPVAFPYGIIEVVTT